MTTLEAVFAPAEIAVLPQRDLGATVCVVFDVLRATTSMVTALGHGAAAIIPVSEIEEALALRRRHPEVLLAGERDGVLIESHLTGGTRFDFGNSPREFTPEKVRGRTIVTTTTNGTRALRACAAARTVLVASLLNLNATAQFLERDRPAHLLLVGAGTYEQAAYEDVLGAGALADGLWPIYEAGMVADSALVARRLYRLEQADLLAALGTSRNGRRLLSRPDLRADVPACARTNAFPLVAHMGKDGVVRVK
jgi:2-phosphosulfolactate phosphatase